MRHRFLAITGPDTPGMRDPHSPVTRDHRFQATIKDRRFQATIKDRRLPTIRDHRLPATRDHRLPTIKDHRTRAVNGLHSTLVKDPRILAGRDNSPAIQRTSLGKNSRWMSVD